MTSTEQPISRRVVFDQYGGVDVLRIENVPVPQPAPDQFRVRVMAAGINPGERSIREGWLHDRFPATFPSGEGSDFAGVVDAVGTAVDGFSVGDEVLGWSDERAAHADYVLVPGGQLVRKPATLDWPTAGSIFVAGATAYAAVEAVAPARGETIVISAAAGGVGGLAAQLARRTGARVLGIASKNNADWLRSLGVEPIDYSGDLAQSLRDAAADGIDAFIDTHGGGYVALAVKLGVSPQRIDTIIDFEAAAQYGTKSDGSSVGSRVEVLAELAGLLADGSLVLPIARTYPLDQVREAYLELAEGHTRGKIALLMGS